MFERSWLARAVFYITGISILQLFNPFVKDEETSEYVFQSWSQFFANLVLAFVTYFLAVGVDKFYKYLFW
jgi:hypothetical protein